MNATRWKNDLIGAAGGWQNMVDWTDETGRTTPPEAIRFDGGGEIGNTAAALASR